MGWSKDIFDISASILELGIRLGLRLGLKLRLRLRVRIRVRVRASTDPGCVGLVRASPGTCYAGFIRVTVSISISISVSVNVRSSPDTSY